jgi:hypothetical protein
VIAQKKHALCLLTAVVFATSAYGQALSYRWPADEMLAYRVEIKAELPDEYETLTGVITYKLKSAGSPSKVIYAGGLTKSTKMKPNAAPRSPGFGPFGPGFGPPSPFSQRANPFKGLERTTSDLVIDSRGSVSAMTDSSQLPYLMGNLSLLIFEPLSDDNPKQWKYDSSVTISEEKQSRGDRFNPFGPFGPFGNTGDDKERSSAASEIFSFTHAEENGPMTTYNKTFQLNAPDGETSFKIEGSGKWTFNTQIGVSESLDFTQQLTITDGSVSIVVPVAIKYERLSSQDYEAYEKSRMDSIVKSKAAARVSGYKNGGYVPPSDLPITAEMKLPAGLLILWKKDSRNYWPATVIEELADGIVKAKEVGGQGRTFMLPRGRLQLVPKDVEQPKSVPEGTLTSLYAQGESAGKLEAAKQQEHAKLLAQAKAKPDEPILGDERRQILEGLRSGKYLEMERALQLIAVRSPRKDGELNQAVTQATKYHDSMLANIATATLPKVLPGPSPATTTGRSASARIWTDQSGSFKIDALYVGVEGDQVVLKRKSDSKEIKVPIARLSDADQAVVKSLQPAKPDNPFEP